MPMSEHGKKAMRGFQKQYDGEKGKRIAYATAAKRGKGSKLFAMLHKGK